MRDGVSGILGDTVARVPGEDKRVRVGVMVYEPVRGGGEGVDLEALGDGFRS